MSVGSESKVLCKGCGSTLSETQVNLQLGNAKYNEWCREGYCSLQCFEKHHTQPKSLVAQEETKTAATTATDEQTLTTGGTPANPPTPPAQETQQFRQRLRIERIAFIATTAIIAGIFGGSATDLGPFGLMFMVGFVMFCFYAGAKILMGIGGFTEAVPLDAAIPAFDWKRFVLDPLYFVGVFLAFLLFAGLAAFFKWALFS